MGTRYIIDVECPECGLKNSDCYYAPTCDFTTCECSGCGVVIDLAEYTGITYEEASNAVEIGGLLNELATLGDQKPSFWPKNPYPESIFPMPRERYAEIVPDSRLRTALSGMLGRQFWNIASEAIWAAMQGEWTETWPVEPGHYWFYGWQSGYFHRCRRAPEPQMVFVKVSKTMSSSLVYAATYCLLNKSEGAHGLWKKAVLPEPPEGS